MVPCAVQLDYISALVQVLWLCTKECRWAFRLNYRAIFEFFLLLFSSPLDYFPDLVSFLTVSAFALLTFQPIFLIDTQSLHWVGWPSFSALPYVSVQKL